MLPHERTRLFFSPTHNFTEAAAVATRLLLLHAGELLADRSLMKLKTMNRKIKTIASNIGSHWLAPRGVVLPKISELSTSA